MSTPPPGRPRTTRRRLLCAAGILVGAIVLYQVREPHRAAKAALAGQLTAIERQATLDPPPPTSSREFGLAWRRGIARPVVLESRTTFGKVTAFVASPLATAGSSAARVAWAEVALDAYSGFSARHPNRRHAACSAIARAVSFSSRQES